MLRSSKRPKWEVALPANSVIQQFSSPYPEDGEDGAQPGFYIGLCILATIAASVFVYTFVF